jgi:hypothetical protein
MREQPAAADDEHDHHGIEHCDGAPSCGHDDNPDGHAGLLADDERTTAIEKRQGRAQAIPCRNCFLASLRRRKCGGFYAVILTARDALTTLA